MPATPEQRRNRSLYQPRLPLTGVPTVATAPTGGRDATTGRNPVTKTHRSTGATPVTAPTAATATPGPVGVPGWRLDEKTRRAGRQGVAAARAVLAGTARAGEERQENAA
jgi:hypothetical protein